MLSHKCVHTKVLKAVLMHWISVFLLLSVMQHNRLLNGFTRQYCIIHMTKTDVKTANGFKSSPETERSEWTVQRCVWVKCAEQRSAAPTGTSGLWLVTQQILLECHMLGSVQLSICCGNSPFAYLPCFYSVFWSPDETLDKSRKHV